MNVHSDHHWPQGSGPYREMIREAADRYGVPVLMLAWLLWEESHFRDDIIKGRERSAVGALGIAQFMPDTARDILGSEELALVPSEAIPGAARYLARLYRSTGSWRNALAAYNWGIGNVLNRGTQTLPAETRHYVTDILRHSGLIVRLSWSAPQAVGRRCPW